MVSPYVNLANVRLLSGDNSGALLVVKQGLARNPDSALLNLLAARVCSGQGDAASAATYFARVQKAAPELAARFPDLAPGGAPGPGAGSANGTGGAGTTQRAASQGTAPTVIWGDQ